MDQIESSLAQLLHEWWEPLGAEQQLKLKQIHQNNIVSWNALPVDDRNDAHPDKAILITSVHTWIEQLMQAWSCNKADLKKAVQQLASIQSDGSDLAALQLTLKEAARSIFLELLWNHPASKALVRSISNSKNGFFESAASLQSNPFARDAVLTELGLWANAPDAQSAQRTTIARSLKTLGHFTSKTTHTQASPVGVVLSPSERSIGPYLTAGLVLEKDRPLWLDQTINDNTGRTGFCIETLNSSTPAGEDDATARLVQSVAAELFAQGHATGTHNIDPRLPQILLPTDDGAYVSVTPLHSQGMSAYLQSQWQPWKKGATPEEKSTRQSFGQAVLYGFSTTAINNFTAIRKVAHALEPDHTVGNIPNKAIVFSAPSLDDAHSELARIRHKGFALRLPEWLAAALFEKYQRHTTPTHAKWAEDTQQAMQLEHSFYAEVLRHIATKVHLTRNKCIDALNDMGEVEQKELTQLATHKTALTRYFLADPNEPEKLPLVVHVARSLAEQLYQQVAALKNKEGKTLGFSIKDRRRFMRWAPSAIARRITQS